VDKKQQKRLEAELRQKVSPLKRKQAKLETDQQKLSERLAELEHLLADSELYDQDNKAKLTSVLSERTSLTQALEESEMQWLELQEEIDAMELELIGQ
ncbi:MAG: ABC transporter ATP-binding protein, partial [Shewanella sp.]